MTLLMPLLRAFKADAAGAAHGDPALRLSPGRPLALKLAEKEFGIGTTGDRNPRYSSACQ
jgi:hypothetical protein